MARGVTARARCVQVFYGDAMGTQEEGRRTQLRNLSQQRLSWALPEYYLPWHLHLHLSPGHRLPVVGGACIRVLEVNIE